MLVPGAEPPVIKPAVLDPDVVLRADSAAVRMGASREVRGAAAVADTFSGRAQFAQPALVVNALDELVPDQELK